MAVPAAIQHPHFLHFLCLTLGSVVMPVVLGDAAETAPTYEAAGIAKVAIAPGGGNVGVARVHDSIVRLVWLVAVRFSPGKNVRKDERCVDCAMLSLVRTGKFFCLGVLECALVLTLSVCKYTLSRVQGKTVTMTMVYVVCLCAW